MNDGNVLLYFGRLLAYLASSPSFHFRIRTPVSVSTIYRSTNDKSLRNYWCRTRGNLTVTLSRPDSHFSPPLYGSAFRLYPTAVALASGRSLVTLPCINTHWRCGIFRRSKSDANVGKCVRRYHNPRCSVVRRRSQKVLVKCAV